jgi:uncharacterized protein (DUF1501 family)
MMKTMNMVNRRTFIRASAAGIAGTAFSSLWLSRAAAQGTPRKKVLIVLFQRGAADGLNTVVPYFDGDYYKLRPTLAVAAPGKPNGVIDLDGRFGLHPVMRPLKDLWDSEQLAVVEATGSPDFSRSHFEAQDYMESGTSGVKRDDGWLNRALKTEQYPTSVFRAISMGSKLPLTLRGGTQATALATVQKLQLGAGAAAMFEDMYRATGDSEFRKIGDDAFALLKKAEGLQAQLYTPSNGARYPAGDLGQGLLQIARLIKGDVGVEGAFLDYGGWDHHLNESAMISPMLSNLAGSLSAFSVDMGQRMEDVVLVTMSEFGRTAFENGNGGSDHGHGNLMLVLGGPVKGGKVYGDWPGLASHQLFQQRDLAVTTDFRDVLGEILMRHVGVTDLTRVFPEYTQTKTLGFIRA